MSVWDPVLELRRITPRRDSPAPQGNEWRKNPKLTRESRERYSRAAKMRMYYEYLDQWRGFIKTIHQIQTTLETFIEDEKTDPKTVTLEALASPVRGLIDTLPKRYQTLVGTSMGTFIQNRDLSLKVKSDPTFRESFVNDLQKLFPGLKVSADDVTFKHYCLQISLPQKSLNELRKGPQGVNFRAGVFYYPQDKFPTIFMFLPKDPPESSKLDPEEVYIHEREHAKQLLQQVFQFSMNLSRTISKEENLTGDELRLTPDIPDVYLPIREVSTPEVFRSALNNHSVKFEPKLVLGILRQNFTNSFRKELLAHVTEKNFLVTQRDITSGGRFDPRNYFKEEFRPGGIYDYTSKYKAVFLDHFKSNNDAVKIWNDVMEVEYQKMIETAVEAFFSVVGLEGNGNDRNRFSGISIEEACDLFGMYSIEDWGNVAERYNTRSYTGTRIVGPQKFYEGIQSSMELLRRIPWYYSIQKYMQEIRYDYSTGRSLIIYNTIKDETEAGGSKKRVPQKIKFKIGDPRQIRPEDRVIEAYRIALTAYQIRCIEQGVKFEETPLFQESVLRYIGTERDLQRLREMNEQSF